MGGYCRWLFHTTALKNDGTLWVCGRNFYGQLGDGTTTDKTSPTQISSQSNVLFAAIGPAANHSSIIKTDRANICLAGYNSASQLGDGTTIDNSSYNCSNWVCRVYGLVNTTGSSYTQPIAGTGNRTDFQNGCALAASVTPSGTSVVTGTATTQTFLDASVQSYNGHAYVQRHYDI